MGQQYTLYFQNYSKQYGNACVYQKDPDIGAPNVMSLAWFSEPAYPTTKLKFTWNIDYSFVWSEVGEVIPGVVFDASQAWKADLNTTNLVTLSRPTNTYTFQGQGVGPKEGTLYIKQDRTVPPVNELAIGIGMSGAGTFVVPAQPNLQLTFTPHPKYYITFGTYKPGEILNIGEITNAAEIAFPPNVYSMTATLKVDNTWSVVPTSNVGKELNAILV